MGNCCTSLESISSSYEDLLNDLFEKLPVKSTDMEIIVKELDVLGVSDKFCLDKSDNKDKTKEDIKAEKELLNKIKTQNNREKYLSNVDTPVGQDADKDELIYEQVFDDFIYKESKFLTITNFHKFLYKYCLIENSSYNNNLLNYFSEWYKLFPNKFKFVGFRLIFGFLSKQPSSKNNSEVQSLFFSSENLNKRVSNKENNVKKDLDKKDNSLISYNDSKAENTLTHDNSKLVKNFVVTDDPVIDGYFFNSEFNKYIFYVKDITTYKLKTESTESIDNLKVSNDEKVKLRYIKNNILFEILFIYIKGITNLTLNHLTQSLLEKRYNTELLEQYRKLWDDRVIIYFIKEKIFKKDNNGSSYIVTKDFVFNNIGLLSNDAKIRSLLTEFSENEYSAITSKDLGAVDSF
jgi:hypothetical protein